MGICYTLLIYTVYFPYRARIYATISMCKFVLLSSENGTKSRVDFFLNTVILRDIGVYVVLN